MFDLVSKEWDELRQDFSTAMEEVVRDMQHDGATEGEITCKVKISLVGADKVEDPTSDGGEAVPAYDAEVIYEVKSSVKKPKAKVTGRVGTPGNARNMIVIGRGAVAFWDGNDQMEMIRDE